MLQTKQVKYLVAILAMGGLMISCQGRMKATKSAPKDTVVANTNVDEEADTSGANVDEDGNIEIVDDKLTLRSKIDPKCEPGDVTTACLSQEEVRVESTNPERDDEMGVVISMNIGQPEEEVVLTPEQQALDNEDAMNGTDAAGIGQEAWQEKQDQRAQEEDERLSVAMMDPQSMNEEVPKVPVRVELSKESTIDIWYDRRFVDGDTDSELLGRLNLKSSKLKKGTNASTVAQMIREYSKCETTKDMDYSIEYAKDFIKNDGLYHIERNDFSLGSVCEFYKIQAEEDAAEIIADAKDAEDERLEQIRLAKKAEQDWGIKSIENLKKQRKIDDAAEAAKEQQEAEAKVKALRDKEQMERGDRVTFHNEKTRISLRSKTDTATQQKMAEETVPKKAVDAGGAKILQKEMMVVAKALNASKTRFLNARAEAERLYNETVAAQKTIDDENKAKIQKAAAEAQVKKEAYANKSRWIKTPAENFNDFMNWVKN
ncbi:MAG: hypothetical protein HOO06_12640 [Bdellovibrionaceae bacterium]|mgnify:CR=1 FL=1|jgi:hypothetical protein|nr:hypothetical protein [Pseudobdellovibrionaceae bacterium]